MATVKGVEFRVGDVAEGGGRGWRSGHGPWLRLCVELERMVERIVYQQRDGVVVDIWVYVKAGLRGLHLIIYLHKSTTCEKDMTVTTHNSLVVNQTTRVVYTVPTQGAPTCECRCQALHWLALAVWLPVTVASLGCRSPPVYLLCAHRHQIPPQLISAHQEFSTHNNTSQPARALINSSQYILPQPHSFTETKMPALRNLPSTPEQGRGRIDLEQRFNPYQVNHNPQQGLKKPDYRRQAAQAEILFQDRFGVCNDESAFHDLNCGHRIQAERDSIVCGSNCVAPQRDSPFACADCITADVRSVMTLKGLSLSSERSKLTEPKDAIRDAEILGIANVEIKKCRVRGMRMCKATEKFEDPKLQFFDSFLREEGFEGVDPSEAKTTLHSGFAAPSKQADLALIISTAASGKKPPNPNSTCVRNGIFGDIGYTSHGKIAGNTNSTQFVPVYKRRNSMKPMTNVPSMGRGTGINKQNNNVSRPRRQNKFAYVAMTDAGRANTAPTGAFQHEDDASKAVRLAMEACVLDERGKM